MVNKIIRNQQYIPHQAVVLTNRKNIKDFSLNKVSTAYKMRGNCIGEDSAVWEIEFHPTNNCNLHCASCSYGTRRNEQSLTVKQITSVLERYGLYDLKSVFFSGGGDPLMWSHWGAFFETVRKPCHYGIATNMFNFSKIKQYFSLFDFYQIHVTGYDSATCKAATGIDAFRHINEHISFLLEHRSHSQDIALKILFNQYNYLQLPLFLDYVTGMEANSVVIKYQQDFIVNKDLARSEVLDHMREIVYSHKIVNEYDYLLDNFDDAMYSTYPRPEKCLFANSGLYRLINAEGAMFPCIAANAKKENRISNTVGFVDIYSKAMRNGECPLKACRHYRFSQHLAYENANHYLSEDAYHIPLLL